NPFAQVQVQYSGDGAPTGDQPWTRPSRPWARCTHATRQPRASRPGRPSKWRHDPAESPSLSNQEAGGSSRQPQTRHTTGPSTPARTYPSTPAEPGGGSYRKRLMAGSWQSAGAANLQA